MKGTCVDLFYSIKPLYLTYLCYVTRIIDQIELRQHKSTIFDISVWSYKHSTVFYVNVTKKSDNTILKDYIKNVDKQIGKRNKNKQEKSC